MTESKPGPTRVGELLRPLLAVPRTGDLMVLRVGLELAEPQGVQEWLRSLDPASHYVVISAVALSVPLKVGDMAAALASGRTRWVELDLELRRGRSARPERG